MQLERILRQTNNSSVGMLGNGDDFPEQLISLIGMYSRCTPTWVWQSRYHLCLHPTDQLREKLSVGGLAKLSGIGDEGFHRRRRQDLP